MTCYIAVCANHTPIKHGNVPCFLPKFAAKSKSLKEPISRDCLLVSLRAISPIRPTEVPHQTNSSMIRLPSGLIRLKVPLHDCQVDLEKSYRTKCHRTPGSGGSKKDLSVNNVGCPKGKEVMVEKEPVNPYPLLRKIVYQGHQRRFVRQEIMGRDNLTRQSKVTIEKSSQETQTHQIWYYYFKYCRESSPFFLRLRTTRK